MAESTIKSSHKIRHNIHITASANRRDADNRNNIDEVIYSLAAAHENKRARQVGEWESSQTLKATNPA